MPPPPPPPHDILKAAEPEQRSGEIHAVAGVASMGEVWATLLGAERTPLSQHSPGGRGGIGYTGV